MTINNETVIKQLQLSYLPEAVEVIRTSFATVARDLGLTEQNCPKYVGYVTSTERLTTQHSWGWRMYGLYDIDKLIGYVSVSEVMQTSDSSEAGKVFEIHNLAVLPEYRHNSHGKRLLDFCVDKIAELGGTKVIISIIEENTVLKNWYTAYGFVHTGTKKYEHLPFTSGYMELMIG